MAGRLAVAGGQGAQPPGGPGAEQLRAQRQLPAGMDGEWLLQLMRQALAPLAVEDASGGPGGAGQDPGDAEAERPLEPAATLGAAAAAAARFAPSPLARRLLAEVEVATATAAATRPAGALRRWAASSPSWPAPPGGGADRPGGADGAAGPAGAAAALMGVTEVLRGCVAAGCAPGAALWAAGAAAAAEPGGVDATPSGVLASALTSFAILRWGPLVLQIAR